MRSTPRPRDALTGIASLLVAGCLAQGKGVLDLHRTGDASAPPPLFLEAGAPPASLDAGLPHVAPHSVVSVDPAHGPFAGGGVAIARGTGFTGSVRVWFGSVEVPSSDVLPIDASHVQVTVPAGSPGLVDVAAQNGNDASTRATLSQGYLYDAFYVTPSSGPVSGGTLVSLFGDGTGWDSSTSVFIDGAACTGITVESPEGAPQQLSCRTPAGTPGSKTVQVVTEAGSTDLQNGFVYGDSDNGFSGGLSGNPLTGSLKVIALNSFTDAPVASATVILGTDTKKGLHVADTNGVVLVQDPSLGPKQTVTIAAHCFMPTTFVDAPVDTVTVYLDPILSPACIDNGQPTGVGSSGGTAVPRATVKGELVWPEGIEFQRAPWSVPFPSEADASAGSRRVAYVFELGRTITQAFRLPSASTAVTPDSDGTVGYAFSQSASIGTLSLYALAGIENRNVTPPLFTAYAMGIVNGVVTQSGATTNSVFIPMNIPLDHSMILGVDGPTPTPRGPDTVQATVGVRVTSSGFVILPITTQTSLLPVTAPLRFVGLPPLVGGLANAVYEMTATASTGQSHSTPLSVLSDFTTTTSGGLFTLQGFVQVPELVTPGINDAWDGQHLVVTAAPGGAPTALTLFQIQDGSGLSTWTVVAPSGEDSIALPDLSTVGDLGLTRGPISMNVSRAKIDGFNYGSLTEANLTPRGWSEYATDVFESHF